MTRLNASFGLSNRILLFGILCATLSITARAQSEKAEPQTGPDVLILANGDKLTGQIENTTGPAVVFKSDMAGEVTVEWSKVKEIQTGRQFAVVPKNVRLKRHADTSSIPQGGVQLADKNVQVKPMKGGTAQSVPVANVAHIIDETTFQRAINDHVGFTKDWVGTVSLGTTLVEATQKNNTISGSVALVRAEPSEDWLAPESRTSFDFSAAYGKLTQPDTPTIKTDLWHLDLEQDKFLTSRLFVFGALAYDHNFSQGLDLQQTYGGGLGFTVIKDAVQEFDVKASVNYIKQQFAIASENQNLIGSQFGEDYTRKLIHGIVFTESGTYTPAWNNTNAYSATAQAGLVFPIYKGFSFAIGSLDTFLNNPPTGFKKNSFQFTTALGYAIK
jgi:hypothetical protein